MLDVVGVNLADAGGNLRTGQSSAEGEHLGANLLVDTVRLLNLHKVVVEEVAATNDLDIVDEVRVDGGEADAAVVHLAGEDLITEEVVAEETRVGVGVVLAVSDGDIDQVTEKGVHGVILLLDIIQVLGVLVNSVGTEDVLEEEEAVVVLVLDRGSVVEHANIAIVHLVVTDHQHARIVDVLLTVGADAGASLAN